MSDPFVAEIRIFAGNFAPRGWAFCSGQLLPISQNTALFSLLGTTYGGNGQTTFALPDLQAKAPIGAGQGPGLSLRQLGQQGGTPTVTLTSSQNASHNHQARGLGGNNKTSPIGNVWSTLGTTRTPPPLYSDAQNVQMNAAALAPTGGGQAHQNMCPYLGVYYIIALVGVYPPRS